MCVKKVKKNAFFDMNRKRRQSQKRFLNIIKKPQEVHRCHVVKQIQIFELSEPQLYVCVSLMDAMQSYI